MKNILVKIVAAVAVLSIAFSEVSSKPAADGVQQEELTCASK